MFTVGCASTRSPWVLWLSLSSLLSSSLSGSILTCQHSGGNFRISEHQKIVKLLSVTTKTSKSNWFGRPVTTVATEYQTSSNTTFGLQSSRQISRYSTGIMLVFCQHFYYCGWLYRPPVLSNHANGLLSFISQFSFYQLNLGRSVLAVHFTAQIIP